MQDKRILAVYNGDEAHVTGTKHWLATLQTVSVYLMH